MNADVLAHLDYVTEQPTVCERPQCVGGDCESVVCRVHQALVAIDHTAGRVSAAIDAMHHVTRSARKEIAEATGDGFANAAAEYGADFNTKKFVRHCGVKPLVEVAR